MQETSGCNINPGSGVRFCDIVAAESRSKKFVLACGCFGSESDSCRDRNPHLSTCLGFQRSALLDDVCVASVGFTYKLCGSTATYLWTASDAGDCFRTRRYSQFESNLDFLWSRFDFHILCSTSFRFQHVVFHTLPGSLSSWRGTLWRG